MNTVILTDSSCDLPLEYIEENNIKFLSLTYNYIIFRIFFCFKWMHK
ncbi:DegV family protein [Clostridium tetani]|nr:DegV family protein [Clostridium tetani]WFN61018.1 DegV family protein [Clostridium tetani]